MGEVASIPGSQQALEQRSRGLSRLLFTIKRSKDSEGSDAVDNPALSH